MLRSRNATFSQGVWAAGLALAALLTYAVPKLVRGYGSTRKSQLVRITASELRGTWRNCRQSLKER
jgi:hypothetical protein